MRKLVLLVLCGLLATGCAGGPESSDGENVTDPLTMLRQRPSFEEATTRYAEMLQKLRDRLSAEFGLAATWEDTGISGESFCQGEELSQISGAREAAMTTWLNRGNIPDAQWQRAQQLVLDMSREYGFSELDVVLDRPGDHKIAIFDQFGAKIDFGTLRHTTIRVVTGCHLTQAAKTGQP